MAELKPCPFCGSTAVKMEAQLLGNKVHCYVVCGICKAQAGTYSSGDSAFRAWDRRKENEQREIG